MRSFLAGILPWMGPPIVGCLIGLAAGAAAAAALRRVLFTGRRGRPGLAARAAGRLLGADALDRLASSPSAARLLMGVVPRLSSSILDASAADLLGFIGLDPGASLQGLATRAVRSLISSRGLVGSVRKAASALVESLWKLPLTEVLASLKLEQLVADRLLAMMAEDGERQRLARSLSGLLADQAELAVTDEVLDGIPRLLSPLVPDAVDALVRWLNSAETRAALSALGRELLPKALEKLNMVQKLFISAAQYDRRLMEKMPEIVDETVLSLERMARDPAEQRRALGLARDAARGWRDGLRVRPVGGADGPGRERGELEAAAAWAADRALASLAGPEARHGLYRRLEAALRVEGQTLGGFCRQALGLPAAEAADAIAGGVLSRLSRPDAAEGIGRALAAAVGRLSAERSGTPLRDIFKVDADRKAALDSAVAARLAAAAPRLARRVLEAVDVEGLLGPGGGQAAEARLAAAGVPIASWMRAFGALLGLLIGLALLLFHLAPGP
jgi:hypothetical protein